MPTAGKPVEMGGRGVIGRTQLDTGDIFDAREASIGAGLDDDFAELLGIDEPPLGVDGVLKRGRARRERRAADNAGGDLHVLLLHRFDEIAGGEASRGQLLGIQPEAHRIIARAEDEDIADAGQAREFILDLEGGVIAQV